MQTFGSSGATGAAEPESDIHPALRSYRALWSVSLIALGGFFVLILMKGWERLSAGAVSWMGFSFFWTVLAFREAHITNGRLRMILALAQVEPVDKKLLDKVLNVTTEGAIGRSTFVALRFSVYGWPLAPFFPNTILGSTD